MPWSGLRFDVRRGTGDQVDKVVFAEVEVDGPDYAVEVYAVGADGRVAPFWRDVDPPADVAAVIELRHVQRALNRIMDAGLAVDGVSGPATRSALRDYQSMEGLPTTGAPDAATRARLTDRMADPDVLATPPPPEPVEAAPDAAERLAEEDARWLQRVLNRISDAGLVVDGRFGPRSAAALTAWQGAAGLPATGVPDDETMARLRAAYEALVEGDDASDPDAMPPAAPLPGRDPVDGRVDHRDEVRWLQAALNRALDVGLVVDGLTGRKTRAAVRRLQSEEGLTVDGIAGRRTLAALRRRLGID